MVSIRKRMSTEKYLKEPELAAVLGIHRNTARFWRILGYIPFHRAQPRGNHLYLLSEVREALARKQEKQSQSEGASK